jgi:hypothetical protein
MPEPYKCFKAMPGEESVQAIKKGPDGPFFDLEAASGKLSSNLVCA